MKYLFLSNYYPPFHYGGYEELCAEVREGLLSRGYDIHVATSRRTIPGYQQEPGVHRVLYNEINYQSQSPNISSFWRYSHKLSENNKAINALIADFKPQGIVVWGMWNLSRDLLTNLENIPGIKILYYIADYWPSLSSAIQLHWEALPSHKVIRLLKKTSGEIILRSLSLTRKYQPLRFEHVLCVSHAVRDRLVQEGALPVTAEVLYNGIDLDMFPFIERTKDQKAGITFLYAGRLSQDKGVHTILEALGWLKADNILPSLTIVGGGDDRYSESLTKLIVNLGIGEQVAFRGYVKRGEIPEILAMHDVQIVPSIGFEPMPRAIQEAMAMKLSVIGSGVGGIPEIVLDRVTGLLFPAGDSRILAEKMRWLIEHPELRKQYAKNGRNLVLEKFNIHRMIDDFEQYLLELG